MTAHEHQMAQVNPRPTTHLHVVNAGCSSHTHLWTLHCGEQLVSLLQVHPGAQIWETSPAKPNGQQNPNPGSSSWPFSFPHHINHQVLKIYSLLMSLVSEKTLQSPLDGKEIKPVNPKGNQPWIFIGGTDAEAEAPILWSSDVKGWLIRKVLMLGKSEGREGDNRGWDVWTASLTRWIQFQAVSRRRWRTGKCGVL